MMRCKFCQSQGNVDLIPNKLRPYTAEDVPEYKPLIELEARGWEPTAFILGEGWKAKALESETIFDDFSLEDSEWVDYDEISGKSVEIMGLETRIDRA